MTTSSPSRRSLLRALGGGGALVATGSLAGCGVPVAYVAPGERGAADRSAEDKRLTFANWPLYIDIDVEVAAELAAWVNYVCPVPAARDVLASSKDEETADLAEDPLIFPDDSMRKRLAIARDITPGERVECAKRWNAIAGL